MGKKKYRHTLSDLPKVSDLKQCTNEDFKNWAGDGYFEPGTKNIDDFIRQFTTTSTWTLNGELLTEVERKEFENKSAAEKQQLMEEMLVKKLAIDKECAKRVMNAHSQFSALLASIKAELGIYDFVVIQLPKAEAGNEDCKMNFNIFKDNKGFMRCKIMAKELKYQLTDGGNESIIPIEGEIEANYTLDKKVVKDQEQDGYQLDDWETDNLLYNNFLTGRSINTLQREYLLLKTIMPTCKEPLYKAASNVLLEYVPQSNLSDHDKGQIFRAAISTLKPPSPAEKGFRIFDVFTSLNIHQTDHKISRVSTKIAGAVICLLGLSVITAGAYVSFISLGIGSLPSWYALLFGAKLLTIGWTLASAGIGASIGTTMFGIGAIAASKKANEYIRDSLFSMKEQATMGGR